MLLTCRPNFFEAAYTISKVEQACPRIFFPKRQNLP